MTHTYTDCAFRSDYASEAEHDRDCLAAETDRHVANCPWCQYVAQGMMRVSERAREAQLAERLEVSFGFVIFGGED